MHSAIDVLRRHLESANQSTVIRALHRMCPCSGSSAQYEELMPLVHELGKDPRPAVRAVALHLELDAFQRLALEDEVANGFVRNRPGGNPRRGETRRSRQRYGT